MASVYAYGAGGDVGPQWIRVTARRVDPVLDPPSPVDDELPTVSIVLNGPFGRTTSRPPFGTIEGSYRITGTFQPLGAPGTYGFRVTRINVDIGTLVTGEQAGSAFGWHMRHSRDGTLYATTLRRGEVDLRGDPLRPISAMGPGTLLYGFHGAAGTQFDMHQVIEGYTSHGGVT